jgi:hypothetical protein
MVLGEDEPSVIALIENPILDETLPPSLYGIASRGATYSDVVEPLKTTSSSFVYTPNAYGYIRGISVLVSSAHISPKRKAFRRCVLQ